MKTHPLLYLLTVLVALNLLATGWLVHAVSTRTVGSEQQASDLPEVLDSVERARLFGEISSRFNAEDFSGLYDRFDDLAKVELDRADTIDLMRKMRIGFGSVSDGIYSHHELTGDSKGRKSYTIYYRAKLTGGEMIPETTGYLKALVFTSGQSYGFTGFSVNAE